MSKAPAYARFLHLTTNLKKDASDSDFEGCEEILAFIAVKEAEGSDVKITDLVQSLEFGTGPTVHRKVGTLSSRGLIQIRPSPNDGRAKQLKLSSEGFELLKERTKLMKQCFSE